MSNDLRRWITLLCEASQASFDDALSEDDRQKSETALLTAERLVSAKGFGFLLGPIKFQNGPIMGGHAFFDKKNNLPIIDATYSDLAWMIDSIIHEAGHKLYFSKGFLLKARSFWAFFDPQARQAVGAYGRKSHEEMFAELFRLFIHDHLEQEQARWIARLAK